jgi:IclR family pca regulon transcriptional regulator
MKREGALNNSDGRHEVVSSSAGRSVATGVRREGDPDFMLSLARGLQVVRALARRKFPATVSQLSLDTGLSRSVVRRCLYTLIAIGFAHRDERRHFVLSVHHESHLFLASAGDSRDPVARGNRACN